MPTITAATTSTSAAAATSTKTTSERTGQQGTAATTAPADTASKERNQHNDEKQDAQRRMGPIVFGCLATGLRNRKWLTTQYLNHGRSTVGNAGGKIPLPERRGNDLINNRGGCGVGQSTFEAVANLDANPPLILGYQQQRTVVFTFLANSPVTAQLVAKVFNGIALEIRQRHHNHLFGR